MRRRDVLKGLAAVGLTATGAGAADASRRQPLGLVIHSYAVRGSKPLEPDFPSLSDPLAFVEHAAVLGAAGVQTRIGLPDATALGRLKEAVSSHGMYLEGTLALPKDEGDVSRFEAEVVAAKAAGAEVLRSVCLSGRRYEEFRSREQFDNFARRSWRSLTLAEPVVAKHRMRLAVENHKDWRVDELLAWLKRLGSEYVGVCLDTGNSIALLEEPQAVVEAYAPWTMTTHLKDMGVAEYDEGFLLSEVPLGQGFLDLPRMVAAIRQARPAARLNLEMITRDPLRVPCLSDGYWATLPQIPASELAAALGRVRRHGFQGGLPTIGGLSQREQLRREAENIDLCLRYAAENLAE
ncbi:MAG TPA: TIM barrel protein [Pirellulales bacterium]|nr:TIM barrel protein [Pirellulales bacterium]